MADDPLLQSLVQTHDRWQGWCRLRDFATSALSNGMRGQPTPSGRAAADCCCSALRRARYQSWCRRPPPHRSMPGPVTTVIQMGAGQVSFTGIGGVTLNDSPETWNLAKQFASATLIATDVADEWVLAGYLEAA
jgi:hypothetical protein